ncbi:RICIN domain-containing protein [Thermomonospora umbrina]|uniref:Uncharacterized protein n=1 Tax=Thermomonospora umbrina TaxID=111806 RepID=A0A3D9SXI4_9ACTN|nr:hypothetical protein [Thermomonospora umbrina]REE99220.1 hypothetical protein DFJ69_4728 [Thermomonospora umbrina]
MTAQSPPTPRDARTAEEYVGRARCLKAWSGYSYRDLGRRAAANGDHLPPSTLATALHRASLPAEPLISAFVRACGGDPATVAEWIDVRRRIAIAAENGTAAPPVHTEPPPADPSPAPPRTEPPVVAPTRPEVRRRALIGVLAGGTAIVVCATASAPGPTVDPAARRTSPTAIGTAAPTGPLLDGWYRVHTLRDGVCLGVEGPSSDPSIVRQPCRMTAGQRFHFQHAGDAAYLIRAAPPPGCVTVEPSGDIGHLRLRDCSPAHPGQLLRIEVLPREGHSWLPSRLRLRTLADPALRVRVGPPGPGASWEGDLRFYLTPFEDPAAVR